MLGSRILVLVLVFVFVFVFDVTGIGMRKAYGAEAASDLFLSVAVFGFASVVLVEMRAVVVIILSTFFYTEFTVVEEVPETGVYIDVGRQGFGDDHPDPRIGFKKRQFLYIIRYVEPDVVGELPGDLYISVHVPVPEFFIEFECHFPVAVFHNVTLAEFPFLLLHLLYFSLLGV